MKTCYEKLSGINFNYSYRLHLVLPEFTRQKCHLSGSARSKNPDQIKIILISFQFIHDIQRRKNPHVIHRDLVSWVARNQELGVRNYVFEKFPISFALFFDETNIVKLGIDHAVCEEIAATDG